VKPYTYAATIVHIIDADSLVCDLDLGRHLWIRNAKHRLAGCNAIELGDPGGREARDNLAELLPLGCIVTLVSVKPYKYGDEYMAQIILPSGEDLVTKLIADGWAASWNGLGPRPVPPWPRL
jgi:endonuclease YncB( thermonuclease family)